jgi:anti-anti-sigma regulatory factor
LDATPDWKTTRHFKGRYAKRSGRQSPAIGWLVLDADAITHVDATGLRTLVGVANDLEHDEITLTIARLQTRHDGTYRRGRRD